MDGGEAVIVAGVGFSSHCRAEELVDLVRRAEAQAAIGAEALAAPAWKAQAECLRRAAGVLALPVLAIERDGLAAADGRTLTQSAIARAAAGVGSVAEAAALAAAGPGARLLLARIASAHATCALSQGDPS
jgi:cobalt-precorrin 5A hydrolase